MIKIRSIAFKLTFFILTSCTIIFALIFGYNYLISRKIIVKNIEGSAKNLALSTVNKIESILLPIEKVPQCTAYLLEAAPYNKEGLLDLLYSLVRNNPEIYGATIAFEPYAFNKDLSEFAPYYYKSGPDIKFTYLEGESYRYFYWDWYQIPKEVGRPEWIEPYFGEGGGILMSSYAVPFYKKMNNQRQFAGIVVIDISLEHLRDIVSSISILNSGYGFLLSKNAIFDWFLS